MTKETANDRTFQAFRSRSTSEIFHVQTRLDKAGRHVVLWKDILLPFRDAKYIVDGTKIVAFMTDGDLEDLIPLRIEHHPNTTLEVIAGEAGNTNTSSRSNMSEFTTASPPQTESSTLQVGKEKTIVASSLADENSGTKINQSQAIGIQVTTERINRLSITDIPPSNNSLTMYSATVAPESRSLLDSYSHLYDSYLQAITNGQDNQATRIITSMDQHFNNLQIEMEKNKTLYEQIQQMQQQAILMQRQMEEKQQEMIQMQKQTLDRLANIQNRVQALLTQTYELHEYPIPRLFIILPKPSRRRDILGRLFSDQFRLFFLCECGSHTMAEGSTDTHKIHLAKHEGYDIAKPNEFFEKYGPYILTVMQMFKYGITTAGVVVPSLEKFKIVEGMETIQEYFKFAKGDIGPLVDDAISFLENQQKSLANGIDTTGQFGFKEPEALEGAELRQLESYLHAKDKGRVLGNLYRIVTTEGHAKWVCIDHYRTNYREKAVNDLREIVDVNGGAFEDKIGKIVIQISSSTQARQFYDAMVKARGIQELQVLLNWDVTMEDLRKFADTVIKANIYHLTIYGDRDEWKGPTTDIINRVRRYDPIVQLASNGRLQSLELLGIDGLFKRVSSSSWKIGQQLRVFRVDTDIKLDDSASRSFLSGILSNCSGLKELQLETSQLKSLVEFILDKLGHQILSGTTDLVIHDRSYQSDILEFSVQKTASSRALMAPPSDYSVSTSRPRATLKDCHADLKIRVISRSLKDFSGDLLSLYSRYSWSIENLSATFIQPNFPRGRFLDRLTQKIVPKRTSLLLHSESSQTVDSLQHIERVIERSHEITKLRIVIDNNEVKAVQEMLKYFHGPIGKRLTELSFKGDFPDSCMSELPARNLLPVLESFEVHGRTEDSQNWAHYIAVMAASPSQQLQDVSSLKTLSQDFLTVESCDSAAGILEAYNPLKTLEISDCQLELEDWTTIIEALDFTTLESIALKLSNFSLEQLKMLVDCIPGEAGSASVVALQKLDLSFTLVGENPDAVQEQFRILTEKVSQIEITYGKNKKY
ncbi:hypothetical protein BGX26_010953 [Mortierella sp. AD094]|nr:hypothetical protein BGX26_010953 [Mortierella sp. AD094]